MAAPFITNPDWQDVRDTMEVSSAWNDERDSSSIFDQFITLWKLIKKL